MSERGGLSLNEWLERVEKRLENLERETAQSFSRHADANAVIIAAIWAEINAMKVANAKISWIPPLITAVALAILTAAVNWVMKGH